MNKLLAFLRITDSDQILSLTNLALIASLGLFVVGPGVWTFGALTLCVIAYNFKRHNLAKIKSPAEARIAALESELKDLKSHVEDLRLIASLKPR